MTLPTLLINLGSDLKTTFTGWQGNLLGCLDARLGNVQQFGRWPTRQHNFEVIKDKSN